MQTSAQQVFEELFQLPENKVCFECGAPSNQWASVNNGIFLCLVCANYHRCFGPHISLVRSVIINTWSDEQLAIMKKGGNAALRSFFNNYNFPQQEPNEFKYHTNAGVYYRDLLKSNSEESTPAAPSAEDGVQLSTAIKHTGFVKLESQASQEKSITDRVSLEGMKSGAALFGTTLVSGMKTFATKMNDQATNPHMKEDMVEFGLKVRDRTKYAAGAVADKSKEVWEKRGEYMDKTSEAMSKGWDSTVSFWKKLTGPKENKEVKEETKEPEPENK